jgi:hypothetical protein
LLPGFGHLGLVEIVQFRAVQFVATQSDTARLAGELPLFEDSLKALADKEVMLKGYMLPLTVDNDRFILSRYPFYNCYFCGNAGRETVVELHPQADDWEFDIDEKVKVRGVLKLIESPGELIFEMEEVVPVEGK